jgi:hypothetical protein
MDLSMQAPVDFEAAVAPPLQPSWMAADLLTHAFHEASHAAAALLQGVEVRRMVLRPDEQGEERTAAYTAVPMDSLRAALTISVAAPLLVESSTPGPRRDDMNLVRSLYVAAGERPYWWRDVFSATLKMVRRPEFRRLQRALGVELAAVGRLYGDRIAAIAREVR